VKNSADWEVDVIDDFNYPIKMILCCESKGGENAAIRNNSNNRED